MVVLENVNAVPPGQIGAKLAAVSLGEKVKLTTERKEITLDPQVLSRYVGAYQMGPGVNMVVTLDKGQLSSTLGFQPSMAIFPESETMFFSKAVDAELEFSADAGQLTLHQNGRDMAAKRVDDADTQRAAKRFKEQTATPGSEDLVRTAMAALRAGNPDYNRMSPTLATTTRQQLPQVQGLLDRFGALQSVSFKGVAPNGADIYQLKFENGSLEYKILMGTGGKVEGAGFRLL